MLTLTNVDETIEEKKEDLDDSLHHLFIVSTFMGTY
jgi:hypothetical protein